MLIGDARDGVAKFNGTVSFQYPMGNVFYLVCARHHLSPTPDFFFFGVKMK